MRLIASEARLTTDLQGNVDLILRIDPESRYAVKRGIADFTSKITADLKKYRKGRSLDANAYCWVLINKLAEKLNLPPVEIYRSAIKDIGGNNIIFPIRDDVLDTWMNNWAARGIGWQCEILGQSKHDGYTNVINWYGSSTYDSKQMAQLVDVIIAECKLQDIETMTPRELAAIKEEWGRGKDDKKSASV